MSRFCLLSFSLNIWPSYQLAILRTQYSIPLCGSSIFIQPVLRCDRLIGYFSYFPLQITMQEHRACICLFVVEASRLIPRKDIASLKGYCQKSSLKMLFQTPPQLPVSFYTSPNSTLKACFPALVSRDISGFLQLNDWDEVASQWIFLCIEMKWHRYIKWEQDEPQMASRRNKLL